MCPTVCLSFCFIGGSGAPPRSPQTMVLFIFIYILIYELILSSLFFFEVSAGTAKRIAENLNVVSILRALGNASEQNTNNQKK